MIGGRIISPLIRDLDTVLMGVEVANDMKQTFLRISQPLSSVKTFLSFLKKQYSSILFTTANG